VDLKQIAGLVNIDMIGRSRPAGDVNPKNEKLVPAKSIYVVGSREISTEFGDWVAAANDGYLRLRYDYYYDQPSKPDRIYFRSDHYNYALKGIPIAFFFNGTHEDYHQVSDEIDKIDFPQMEAISRTIYMTLYSLADKKTRPRVNAKS
jgi:Zn-dependent M28 family amino/carboxypeptidase